MNQEYLEYIINNLGTHGEKAWVCIYDHKHEAINIRDNNGVCILVHAIRMNDGGNVAYLLSLGADMNAITKTGLVSQVITPLILR